MRTGSLQYQHSCYRYLVENPTEIRKLQSKLQTVPKSKSISTRRGRERVLKEEHDKESENSGLTAKETGRRMIRYRDNVLILVEVKIGSNMKWQKLIVNRIRQEINRYSFFRSEER